MIIDAGVSCSVMSKKFFNSIPANDRPTLVNENICRRIKLDHQNMLQIYS